MALSVAVLLAVALIYTSFSASTEAKEPSQLLNAAPGTSYELTGKVVPGSIKVTLIAVFWCIWRSSARSDSPIAAAANLVAE